MNRRNVLTGLGGLAISGGALFGTGAFTSVSAERTVEVNVTTGSGVADEYVDVLVYAGHDTVDVASSDPPSSAGSVADETTLFPKSGDSYSSWDPSNPALGTSLQNWVSLIENDVNIEFGRTNGLPNNSQVSYNPLFAVVNDDPGSGSNYNVYIEYASSDAESNYLKIGGDAKGTSEEPLNAGNSAEYNSVVDTVTGGDGDTISLTVRIESP
jgi:hypothetical protein